MANIIRDTWWRFFNKKQYRLSKQESYRSKVNNFLSANTTLTLPDIKAIAAKYGELNLVHTGNVGDVIFALPVLKKLHETITEPLNLFLKINEPMRLAGGFVHPLNNVMLSQSTADMLQPLMLQQPYISSFGVYNNERIDVNLSLFRKAGIRQDRGNIARWNFYTTGVTANLSEKWLFVEPANIYSNSIVIARSQRYNNPIIDYSFLAKYPDVVFIGVKDEYKCIEKFIPNIKWVQVKDFLEMAQIIAGCKFFIGNQSFPFSLAEGLKVPRILETYHASPNVVIEGANGYDFYFQSHFEAIVSELNNL